MTESIDSGTVLALARAQGQAWVDEDVARRLAAAATAAVLAVNASLPSSTNEMLADPAAEFIATLETLAETGA
jgi:hypothetical protein